MLVHTLEGAAEWLRAHFDPRAARGLACVVQLELSGAAGGSLRVRIDGGRLVVEPGATILSASLTSDDDRRATRPAHDGFAGSREARHFGRTNRTRSAVSSSAR